MRETAAAVGITPALVLRSFESKPKLFEAAIADQMSVATLITGDRATVGRSMVESRFTKPEPEWDVMAILLLRPRIRR